MPASQPNLPGSNTTEIDGADVFEVLVLEHDDVSANDDVVDRAQRALWALSELGLLSHDATQRELLLGRVTSVVESALARPYNIGRVRKIYASPDEAANESRALEVLLDTAVGRVSGTVNLRAAMHVVMNIGIIMWRQYGAHEVFAAMAHVARCVAIGEICNEDATFNKIAKLMCRLEGIFETVSLACSVFDFPIGHVEDSITNAHACCSETPAEFLTTMSKNMRAVLNLDVVKNRTDIDAIRHAARWFVIASRLAQPTTNALLKISNDMGESTETHEAAALDQIRDAVASTAAHANANANANANAAP